MNKAQQKEWLKGMLPDKNYIASNGLWDWKKQRTDERKEYIVLVLLATMFFLLGYTLGIS